MGPGKALGLLLNVSLQAFNLKLCYYSSDAQLSSPSKTPGMPTKSNGIPSSASASMFSGCSRARREAKPGVVYCPLARPVFGMSRSLGGFGGGGRALEYLILAMKSWRACEDCEDDILTIDVGTNDRCLERGSLVEMQLWCLRCWFLECFAGSWKELRPPSLVASAVWVKCASLVARLLKDTRTVSAPAFFLSCPQPAPFAPALTVGLIRRIQTIGTTIVWLRAICAWIGASHLKSPAPGHANDPAVQCSRCKLGGFNLLHSIEDRSLHNAFSPKALIPSPQIFWPVRPAQVPKQTGTP